MASPRRIRTLLVANRGEIAVRILRSAQALGMRTVAVFSDADKDAPHVQLADCAICLGAAPARDSYLSIERLLAACARCDADALHPGYGFLSENAELAARCARSGITFVGPPPEDIELMGDKARAKRRLLEAGVPVVPGYHGGAQDDATLGREARRLGFPVLIKAVAGGGGRGMRLCEEPGQLAELLRSARAEAQAAFGHGDLLLEKLLHGARHVEVQVFGDQRGSLIHLGERDCSVQRRHQKVIEEAPCPVADAALRRRLGEAAVAAARAVGYVNAGTVEFLLTPAGHFFFIEMNTRLQVEHAVTEQTTGIDLVAWQLMIAEGAALPLAQDEVSQSGHAIEARLYAEDPARGFLPQAGRILCWRAPRGEGIRVDAGVSDGQVVSAHYDPLLAKIIATGPTREVARRRLSRAVRDTLILGLTTNRELLLELLEGEAFAACGITTETLDARLASGPPSRPRPAAAHLAVAAVLLAHGGTPADVWRNAGRASWRLRLVERDALPEIEHETEVSVTAENVYSVRLAESAAPVSVTVLRHSSGELRCEIDGIQRTVAWARGGDDLYVQLDDVVRHFAEPRTRGRREESRLQPGVVLAPISGQVVAIAVRPGESVVAGQCLVVLEAMKMEHRILAPAPGVVARLAVAAGEQVSARQLLVEVTPRPESPALPKEEEA
jgi:geranyl-CoA carboxylase alpha subunit